MEWKVFRYSFSEKEVRLFNLFDHAGFWNDFCKLVKKCKDKESFAKDPMGTMENMARIGYRYVEMANSNALNDDGTGFQTDLTAFKEMLENF